LAVAGDTAVTTHPHAVVVRINPLGEGFWRRLDGSLDFGLGITKANSEREFNFAIEVEHRSQKFETRVRFNSLFSTQEGSDDTNRHVAEMHISRLLAQRWLWAVVGQFQRNDELQLELRSLGGVVFGRYLVHSNRTTLNTMAGLAVNSERFTGEEASENVEAIISVQFQKFTFDDLDTDITAATIVAFDLSDAGRVRIDLNASVRREILKDFYLSINFFENFDSRPPVTDVERNDYGLLTSFGWSF
jgi:hypothetical protein